MFVEGNSAVNEAALTGESIPADKAPGDTVSAATLNQSGYPVCEATRIGEDTTLSQIIRMVSDAAATKAPHCQGGRPGIRRLRAGGHHHCADHNRASGCWQEKTSVLPWPEAFLFW